ncbi:hypothetical protein VTO73DRAFT_10075 [Trametes versicolor]
MRSSTLPRLVLGFIAPSPLFAHVVRTQYSWPNCTESCRESNVQSYGGSVCDSASTSSVCICPNQAAAIALHGCLVDDCTIYDQFVEAEGAFQADCAAQLDPQPSSSSTTLSLTTSSAVAHLETGLASPPSSASSHAGLSKTAILAIAIVLGICAVVACVSFLWKRRRRSRTGRWARSESIDGEAVKEYHAGGDGPPACREWRGVDTAPATLSQRNPFDDDAESPAGSSWHHTESLDGFSMNAEHGSDMGERDADLVVTRKHSRTVRPHRDVEDPFADPPLSPERDITETRLREDGNTMVLLRVPLGVAKRVLAAMHAGRSGGSEAEGTEEEDRRDSETLPAYSSPSSLELGRSEPSQT